MEKEIKRQHNADESLKLDGIIPTSTRYFFRNMFPWIVLIVLVACTEIFMRAAPSSIDYEKKLALDSATHFLNLFFSLVWFASFFALTRKLPLWSRVLIFAVFFLPVAFSLYLQNYHGMEINISFVTSCINTHWKEVRGFISLYVIGCFIAFIAIMFGVAWLAGKIPNKLPKSKIFIVGLVAVLTISPCLLGDLRVCIFPMKAVYDVKNSLKFYKKGKLDLDLLENQENEPQEICRVPAEISHVNTVPVVVLHIGETARADHAPFNGYRRNTMPNMLREYEAGNLVSFPKCVSFSTETVISMRGILSPSTVLENTSHNPTFIPALNQSGVETCGFCSGFKPQKDIFDTWVWQLLGRMQDLVCTEKSAHSLLPKIKETLSEGTQKEPPRERFYLYYGEGSHDPFTNYDYERHAVFKPNGMRRFGDDRDVNNYDNTFIAVDEFCGKFIDDLREENAVYIFVGDHGQMLGEDGLQGREPWRKESRHVLFFIWASEKFKKENPEIWATLLRNRERLNVVSHDFVYNSVLHLFSLKTLFYDEKADLFSDSACPFPVEIPGVEESG